LVVLMISKWILKLTVSPYSKILSLPIKCSRRR
jgi:hypothetical protein